MQNPNFSLRQNVASPLAVNGRLSRNQGGRTLDEVAIVDVTAALEQQGSSVSPNLLPAMKKGRSVEVSMMVEDIPMEVMRDVDGGTGDLSPAMLDSKVKDPSRPIPSFKEKLWGNPGFSKQAQYVEELDVEVWDEDVRIGGADGVTLEGLGSEKRKVGRSTGSPHKREVVVKGRLVDNSKDSVLQGRRSKNVESVDTV
ncbi:hypothetical protein V6N13_099237 [Hibiscus sabdariffa]